MSELTIKDKIEEILQKIKYQTLSGKISEEEWRTQVWFEITDETRQAIMQLIDSAITEAENRGELELAEEMLSWDCVLNDKLTLSRVMERVDYLHSELKDNTSV